MARGGLEPQPQRRGRAEAMLGLMAGGAGDAAVGREPTLEEQPLPELSGLVVAAELAGLVVWWPWRCPHSPQHPQLGGGKETIS